MRKNENHLNNIPLNNPDHLIEIINYTDDLKGEIKSLNTEWLEKYFYVEPNDIIQLSNPLDEIISKQGMIFYAKIKGKIIGTASLLKVNNEVYELGKMAVTAAAQGQGAGKALIEHVLNIAAINHIKKLVLYSNTMLEPAIHLYKKYGFKEVPLEGGHYNRANIKMEKELS